MHRETTIDHQQASARLILPVLLFSSLVMSIVATLGTPMIPTISRELDISLEAAQWTLTVTLLVGAVVTPIAGRLADGPHRKLVVVGLLGAVCSGAVISASIRHFPAFLLGRALQGVGLAILPMAIAVARDTLPQQQARSGIAFLSVMTAAGTGLGYPLTGFLGERFGFQVPFGFAALISLVAAVLIGQVVPARSPHETHPLDIMGAALLSIALVCLLLVISQGRGLGWTSLPILALAGGAVVFGALWVMQELRVDYPLVELRLALNPLVMSANVTSFLMGMGLFGISSLVNRFVQAPEEVGYGFHAGLLLAGWMLMPLSLGSFVSTWLSRWLDDRLGPFLVLPIGASIVAFTGAWLAFVRTETWQVMIAVGTLGLGISTAFAAMPGLIIRAVPPHETGSATGLNSVLRSVGGAIGSAASIAVLSSYTPAGEHLPANHGYTIAFLVGALACLCGVVASVLLMPRDA